MRSNLATPYYAVIGGLNILVRAPSGRLLSMDWNRYRHCCIYLLNTENIHVSTQCVIVLITSLSSEQLIENFCSIICHLQELLNPLKTKAKYIILKVFIQFHTSFTLFRCILLRDKYSPSPYLSSVYNVDISPCAHIFDISFPEHLYIRLYPRVQLHGH